MKEGVYKLGPQNTNLWIHTYKSGTLSIFSHDLLIKVNNFQLEIIINSKESKLSLNADTNSLEVICVVIGEKRYEKLLTDKDKKEIEANIRSKDILDVKKFPAINFISNSIKEEESRIVILGELTIRNCTKSAALILEKDIEKPETKFIGRFSLVQTEFGIRPFTTMFNSLGVQDKLDISWEINL